MHHKSLIQSIFNAGDALKRGGLSKDHTVKPESGGVILARDLIKMTRKTNCNLS